MRKAQVRPALLQFYRSFLDDRDRSTFVLRVARRYGDATLERLYQTGDRVSRRAAVLALGYLATRPSSTTLGAALHDSDRAVRMVAEDALRGYWSRSAGPAAMYAVAKIVRLNRGQLYDRAADEAEQLLDACPDFGEGWHQLGLACVGVMDHARARLALEHCLSREPLHFLASHQLARVLLAMGDTVAALQQLRDTLDIHPDWEPARLQWVQLKRSWHRSR